MLRLLGILVTVLVAISVAVLTWPMFFRVERMYPITQIVAFRAIVFGALALLLVVVLLLAIARPVRGFAVSLAFVAIVGLVANGTILVSRGLGTNTLPQSTDTSVRVMTWNTAGAATGADSIAEIAVAMEADIVTLPETTIETGEQVAIAMRALGRPMWAYSEEYDEEGYVAADALSTTILITPDLGNYAVIESSVNGTTNTSTLPSVVVAPTSGEGPIVVAAHAVAPRPSYMAQWDSDLKWLADQCSDANVILAGDFNATLDHMGGLSTSGATMGTCTDVASRTGNGSVGTWPSTLPAVLGAPIDHVMASPHWQAVGSLVLRTMDGAGSDHRPLIVQLEPVG